ncbi:MAG: hypothetical protein IJT02_06790 [Synergistaceae bacterium]|nr:hypothetical protein [Synergistaceae bacterium]
MTDTQYLAADELHKLPECINAMANSSGGIITLEGGRKISVATSETVQVLGGKVYRRIEGQNVLSNKRARSVMALRSGDDFPAEDSRLDSESVEAFRRVVLGRNAGLRQFARMEFMRRTGIMSGTHVTFAGALMFGEALTVKAELRHKDIRAEIEQHNIWDTMTVILPRLTRRLSAKSADNVRDALASALLRADYCLDTHINIAVLSSPPRIETDCPGIIRPRIRNHRLARMFALAGFSSSFFPAEQDMLNFRAHSTIFIEGITHIVL